jgi:hypothetical protein
MSISAGLDWTGNLSAGADDAASKIERLAAALRALESVRGGAKNGIAGAVGGAGGGAIGALGVAANRAAIINEKSAADLAKIGAKASADQATVGAKSAADIAKIEAQQKAQVQAALAQQETAKAKALADVVKNQAKTADAAYLAQTKGAEASKRAAEQVALTEQKGANQAAAIRAKSAADLAKVEAKGAADRAKIEAKSAADIARDNNRAAMKARTAAKAGKVSEATTSGVGGAARAILDGKGLQGALGAFGGKGARVAAIAKVALDVGRAAFNAAKQVAGIGFEFGKAVVSAQAYREDVAEAFTTVTGSVQAGDAVMKRALATADRLGTARADTVGQFLDLTTKGFDVAMVDRIVSSLNDLTTIDPKASMEGLTKVIGKVQATGRLNQETLNELSTFGLEQSDVIKEIGKILGKNDAQVLKALSTAGGIRGLGVEPILRAINKQVGGGPAGEKATEKANRNLSSLIRRVGEVPQNILFDLEVGPGLDGIKGVLRSVLNFFASGSETAERAKKAFGDAFNALASGLLGKDVTENSDGITDTLNLIVKVIEDSKPAIEAFGAVIRLTLQAMGMFGSGLGAIIGFFSDGESAAIGDSASKMGTNIIDGFVGGITAGAQRVIDAVKSVASGALGAAATVLRIGSPSKAFAQIGAWSSEGMAIGLEREAGGVASAARTMAQDAQLAASIPMPLLGSGAAAMGGAGDGTRVIEVRIPPGLIVVQAAPSVDAAALAEELDPLVRKIMIAVWRQIKAEGGVN